MYYVSITKIRLKISSHEMKISLFKNSSNNKFTIKKVAANKVAFVVTDASDGTIRFKLNLV